MSHRTNENGFIRAVSIRTILWYGLFLLMFCFVLWSRAGASRSVAASALTPIFLAGSATPTAVVTKTLQPTIVFFVTPPPVRTEEPLSPDSRNIPSVFAGVDEYYPVQATLSSMDQPPPLAANLPTAASAVVQILRCDNFGCDTPVGSGVIIHPRGLIITAYHVLLTEPDDPTSPRYSDFVISMTENTRSAPQPRYQAHLAASKDDLDLAVLVIDRTLSEEPIAANQLNLPALPLADVTTLFGDELHVLGYPVSGGEAISYVRTNFGSFDDDGRLIVVDRSLDPGNSGGPALVMRENRFAIAGLVIRRRSVQGQLSQQGLVRAVDQLYSLTWTPRIERAWGEGVQAYTVATETTSVLQLSLTMNTVDLIGQSLRLLFYATDAATDQPWRPAGTDTPLVVWADLEPQTVIDRQVLTLTVPVENLGIAPDQLRFRALLWDRSEENTLWSEQQGVQAIAVAATEKSLSTSDPAPAMPATPTPTSQPTATSTKISVPTKTPSPTHQPTATDIPVPPTKTHTPIPDTTATAAAEATTAALLQKAVAATLTAAAPTPTPTALSVRVKTQTLNIRSGPGLNYQIISSVAQNTELVISGQANGCAWFQVYYRGIDTGWVSGAEQYVSFGGNCDSIPAVDIPPTPIPPTPVPLILNVKSNSGHEYRLMRREDGNGLAVNQPIYTDRSYVYSAVPAVVQGATYILPSNEDKWSSANNNLLEISSNKAIQVYVAYSDGFVSKASWLQAYQDTGLDLKFIDNESREVTLSLYSKTFAANSTIVLGGNTPDGSGTSSMYTVALKVNE